jgi:hypothetical protein
MATWLVETWAGHCAYKHFQYASVHFIDAVIIYNGNEMVQNAPLS